MKNFSNTNIYLTLAIFSKYSKFYDGQCKIVAGKMKVEHKGIPVKKFVGLKSKMHSMLSGDGKESNTAKGINTATEFNEFKETLFNKKVIRHKIKRIQGKKHKTGTYENNNTSLSCFDDKRFVLDDGIQTLAYFHKDFKKIDFYRWSWIKEILKDDHKKEKILTDDQRFTQIKISAYK